MTTIKFGTDGWRAIIADDYTVENVRRVAAATLKWIDTNFGTAPVVIGYDCRFGGKMFSEVVARVIASKGNKVFLSKDFVSTPMVSLATTKLNASCGIIITASHNPPSYNGYKLKGQYGGPALPEMIEEVEKLIPDHYVDKLPSFEDLLADHKVEYFDMEAIYVQHAEESFDMDAIRESGLKIAYDAMFGAGQNAVRRLLPESFFHRCDYNPSFKGVAPEPIMKNLESFADFINRNGEIDFAFATDGDADRIGILDGKGNFVDSHHIILMLINYLHKYKQLTGKVVNSFSCTSKIKKMCELYELEQITTKIGFKYICGHMVNGGVLVGGEESGGIAVDKHIPERDGVWIALTLIEYMAKTGKSLQELIDEVYNTVGKFALERYDLHIAEEEKARIIKALKNSQYTSFGKYNVASMENLDGFKFHLGNESWVMVRPSGTEPVLRVYAEAPSYDEAVAILDATKETLFAEVAA